MSFLDNVEPVATRGVVSISANCDVCNKPVAVLGLPGKGRPIETFSADYFCPGHPLFVERSSDYWDYNN